MANQNLLTGAVMLETMWKTRHTSKGKEKAIDYWLVRRANKKYDRVFTVKQEEYRAIAEGNSGKAKG